MTFPLTLLGIAAVFVAFGLGVKLAAGIGTKKALAYRALLRDATPPHDFTNLDGTKGRWP